MSKEVETLEALVGKHAAALDRLDGLRRGADAVAYGAHTGDKAAATRLEKINMDEIAEAANIRSIESAILEARRRVLAAEAVVLEAAEVEKARNALDALDAFRVRGHRLDRQLEEFVGEYLKLEGDYRELQRLGYAPASSFELIAVNARLAAGTALQRAGLQDHFLAPHERRTFSEIFNNWATSAERRANATIQKHAPAAAE